MEPILARELGGYQWQKADLFPWHPAPLHFDLVSAQYIP